MISIDIETRNGNLIKLPLEEAEEVYLALKQLFDKTPYPIVPTYPIWPTQPWVIPTYRGY